MAYERLENILQLAIPLHALANW